MFFAFELGQRPQMNRAILPDELLAFSVGAIYSLSISWSALGEWAARLKGPQVKGARSDLSVSNVPDALFGEIYRRRVPLCSTELLLAPCASNGLPAAGLKSLFVPPRDLPPGEPSLPGPFVAHGMGIFNARREFLLGLKEFTVLYNSEAPGPREHVGPHALDTDSNSHLVSVDEVDAVGAAESEPASSCIPVDGSYDSTATDLTVFALVTNVMFNSSLHADPEDLAAEAYCSTHSSARSSFGKFIHSSLTNQRWMRLGAPTNSAGGTVAIAMASAMTRRQSDFALAAPGWSAAVQGLDSYRVRCNISFIVGDGDDDLGDSDDQPTLRESASITVKSPTACEGVYMLRSMQLPAPANEADSTPTSGPGEDREAARTPAGVGASSSNSGRSNSSGDGDTGGVCVEVASDGGGGGGSDNGVSAAECAAAAALSGASGGMQLILQVAELGCSPPAPSPLPTLQSDGGGCPKALGHGLAVGTPEPAALVETDSGCCGSGGPLVQAGGCGAGPVTLPSPAPLTPTLEHRALRLDSRRYPAEGPAVAQQYTEPVPAELGGRGAERSPRTPAKLGPSHVASRTPRSSFKSILSPRLRVNTPEARQPQPERPSVRDVDVGLVSHCAPASPTPPKRVAEARLPPPVRQRALGPTAAGELGPVTPSAARPAASVMEGGAFPLTRCFSTASNGSVETIATTASSSLVTCNSTYSCVGQRAPYLCRMSAASQNYKLPLSTLKATAATATPAARAAAAAAALQLSRRRQAREEAQATVGPEAACPGYLRPTVASARKSIAAVQRSA